MPSKISSKTSLLPVPSAGPGRYQSTTKSATYNELNSSPTPTSKYHDSFLLGGETPPSRISLPTSKIPTRSGSYMSREGSDPSDGTTEGAKHGLQSTKEFTGFLRRSPKNADDLRTLGPVFEALKAHAEGQEEGSVRKGKVSRGGSSDGDGNTVRG